MMAFVALEDTAIMRKLRRLMRNVPKGGLMFISLHDMKRLESALSQNTVRRADEGGIRAYVVYHRSIWLERRKK